MKKHIKYNGITYTLQRPGSITWVDPTGAVFKFRNNKPILVSKKSNYTQEQLNKINSMQDKFSDFRDGDSSWITLENLKKAGYDTTQLSKDNATAQALATSLLGSAIGGVPGLFLSVAGSGLATIDDIDEFRNNPTLGNAAHVGLDVANIFLPVTTDWMKVARTTPTLADDVLSGISEAVSTSGLVDDGASLAGKDIFEDKTIKLFKSNETKLHK